MSGLRPSTGAANAIRPRLCREAILSIDPISGRPHNAWLDWLRFAAAFEVVLTHARTVGFAEYAKLDPASHTLPVTIWTALTRLGQESVLVFFVLSGFLVGGRALDQARSKTFSIGKYVVDRVVRIQIPLAAAILLTVVVYWPQLRDLELLAGHFFSLQGVFVPVIEENGVLWTLSYEVWFYIIGGALAFMINRRGFGLIAALLVLAGIFVFTRLNAVYLFPWVAGAAAYQWRPKTASFGWLAAGTLIAAAGVATFQLTKSTTANPAGHPLGVPASTILIGIGIALVLPHLYRLPLRESWFSKLGTWLSSFSYSLYLIHLPILALVVVKERTQVTGAAMADYAAGVLAAMVGAYLFSRLFETNGARIKGWIYSIGGRSKPAAAAGPGSAASDD